MMNMAKAATLSNLIFTVSPSPPASVFESPKSFKHFGTMFYVPVLIVSNDSATGRYLHNIYVQSLTGHVPI
jgi:hypothetical protein